MLASADNSSAVNVLDWWLNNKSVYMDTDAVVDAFLVYQQLQYDQRGLFKQ